ncbi:hypothetical protein [Streptomyces sp. NPDC021608]|uniref:hypothetical protein n=1 Tax=Streptomyces sp. NPDC021608 TaxID=3154903 RepID=UPI003411526A
MRKTAMLTIGLLAAAGLLTGCGGEQNDAGPAKAEDASASDSGAGGSSAGSEGVPHQVVFEVGGTGTAQVMGNGNSNHFEKVTLPWTKTESMRLEGAELQVGVTVAVVPGSVKGAAGTLKPAPCTIEVDGEQVADNQGGKSAAPCAYKLKS